MRRSRRQAENNCLPKWAGTNCSPVRLRAVCRQSGLHRYHHNKMSGQHLCKHPHSFLCHPHPLHRLLSPLVLQSFFLPLLSMSDRLVGLVVKASRLESGRSRVRTPLAPRFFRGQIMLVTSKLAVQWLPCQAPGRYRVSAGTGRPGVSIL